MLCGGGWCVVVAVGALWWRLVLCGDGWCVVVAVGALWWWLVRFVVTVAALW